MSFACQSDCSELPEDARKLLERSSLYREFMAEREEILKHKWMESEKAGRDIGFECALASWVVHHCAHWRKARRSQAPCGAWRRPEQAA